MAVQSLQHRSTYLHLPKRPPQAGAESEVARLTRRGLAHTLAALLTHPIFVIGIICAAVVLPAAHAVLRPGVAVPTIAFWALPPFFLAVTVLAMLLMDANWNTERGWRRPKE